MREVLIAQFKKYYSKTPGNYKKNDNKKFHFMIRGQKVHPCEP